MCNKIWRTPDQLSKKFWGIDRFRIKALEKLLLYYELSSLSKKDMLEALLNKIKIIITGAKKRKNIKMIRIYSFKEKYWLNQFKMMI